MKNSLKNTILKSQFLPLVSRMAARHVAVLRYHSVLPRQCALASRIGKAIVHDTDTFAEHMALLSKQYGMVRVGDLFASFQRKTRRSICITFDDGFRDNYQYAAPILERYGLRATFYVTAGCIDGFCPPWFCRLKHSFHATSVRHWRDADGNTWNLLDFQEKQEAFRAACAHCAVLTGDSLSAAVQQLEEDLDVRMEWDGKERLMMTASEIRDLDARGHTIGSHGMEHPNIGQIPESAVRREMQDSKTTLEDILGHEVKHFSYPSPILQPHYTDETTAICKECGYATAVTCKHGACSSADNPFIIPRISAPQDALELHWAIENAFIGRRV